MRCQREDSSTYNPLKEIKLVLARTIIPTGTYVRTIDSVTKPSAGGDRTNMHAAHPQLEGHDTQCNAYTNKIPVLILVHRSIDMLLRSRAHLHPLTDDHHWMEGLVLFSEENNPMPTGTCTWYL